MIRRVMLVALLAGCVDPDVVAPYQGELSPELEKLLAKANERKIEDPEVDVLLAKLLLDAKLAEHGKTLGRELTDEERTRVEAALVSRSPDGKLALAARAAGYTRHPYVAAKLITALENDELKKNPPSQEALRAAFADQLTRFDASKYHDRTSLSARLHPELLWVRVWETKNKALAGAIPKLPNKPNAREVGPLAKQSTQLPLPVTDAAFALTKPEAFSKPIAIDDRFYVVQRVTKVAATTFADVSDQVRKMVDERRRPAIRRALLSAEK